MSQDESTEIMPSDDSIEEIDSQRPLYFRDDVVEKSIVHIQDETQFITVYINADEIPTEATSQKQSTENDGELLVDILGRSGVFREITMLLQATVAGEDPTEYIAKTAQLAGRTEMGHGRFVIPIEM